MYYITRKNSETGKKMQELLDKASAIRKEISEYLKLLGANPNQWGSSDRYMLQTHFYSALFDETPDMKIWKECKELPGTYQPRRMNYEGKKIALKFESIEPIERDAINEIIGYGQVFRYAGYDINNPDYFCFKIEESWNHTMPEDCEEITYKRYLELFN